jgi:hypothetical protein
MPYSQGEPAVHERVHNPLHPYLGGRVVSVTWIMLYEGKPAGGNLTAQSGYLAAAAPPFLARGRGSVG